VGPGGVARFPGAAGQPAPPSGRRSELRAGFLAALMNLPALACLAVILAYPIAYAAYLSVHEVSLRQLRTGEFPWAGAANFARLFDDSVFWQSLWHTAIFVAASVILEVLIALGVAVVIEDDRVWVARGTRALILLPWAVPPVVNGLLWAFIFNGQYGYLNRLLQALGVIAEPINWLGAPALAMGAVITAYVWRTTPFNILLYHAALQGIPGELYEAAAVDGATGWQRFCRITLPLLSPVIAVSLILRTTFGFMVFDEILAITQGGPGNATWVAAWYTYRVSFQPPFNIGLGAASAWVLALLVGAIGLAYVRLLYRRADQ
jgi:ABC-type sugar transport system permease subunit